MLLSLVLLCSCGQAKLKRVRVAPQPPLVGVQVVQNGATMSQKNYVGTVETSREAYVNAIHGGVLESVYVKEGDRVVQGQALAKVSSQTIRSSYDMSQALLKQALDGYERAQKVYESGSITEVKMVEIRTQLEQAQASAAAAASALEDCVVRAPFAGQINRVQKHAGEHITAAQPLFDIVDGGSMEIVISVPESEIHQLAAGDKALVQIPATGDSFPAVVKTKSLTSDALTRSYKCSLSIVKAPKEPLLAGMVCKVYMDRTSSSGIVIPADAVKSDNEGRYVWVISQGQVRKTRVLTDGYRGKGVVVRSGLAAGDSLIVDGTSKVSSGMKVRVEQK